MVSNELEYQGFTTKIYFSSRDKVLYGKLENIADLVSFESTSSVDIENAFREAVDDYLNTLNELW